MYIVMYILYVPKSRHIPLHPLKPWQAQFLCGNFVNFGTVNNICVSLGFPTFTYTLKAFQYFYVFYVLCFLFFSSSAFQRMYTHLYFKIPILPSINFTSLILSVLYLNTLYALYAFCPLLVLMASYSSPYHCFFLFFICTFLSYYLYLLK